MSLAASTDPASAIPLSEPVRVAENSAVIYSSPKLGDLIWHQPFIEALAKQSPSGQIDLIANARNPLLSLFRSQPYIREIFTLPFLKSWHQYPEIWQLQKYFRQQKTQQVWQLDKIARPMIAATLAGVPERYAYGQPHQRRWLTQTHYMGAHWYQRHYLARALAFFQLFKLPLPNLEPTLIVPEAVKADLRQRFSHLPQPWFALGIDTGDPFKRWPLAFFQELIARYRGFDSASVFLVAGPNHSHWAEQLKSESHHPHLINATNLSILETAGLLTQCEFFLGNDSGPLNLSAAVGCSPSYGLFGATPPLWHTQRVKPILGTEGLVCCPFSEDPVKQRKTADSVSVDHVLSVLPDSSHPMQTP